MADPSYVSRVVFVAIVFLQLTVASQAETQAGFCRRGSVGISGAGEQGQLVCCPSSCGGCSASTCSEAPSAPKCCPESIAAAQIECRSPGSTGCILPLQQAENDNEVYAAAAPSPSPPPKLKCPDTFAACPGWVGQCAVPGVATYCPCMCGRNGPSPPPKRSPSPAPPKRSPSPAPPRSPTPPPKKSPTPSPKPGPGCPDTFAACPGWGKSSCTLPGVAALCPCMCNGGPTPASPSPAPPPNGKRCNMQPSTVPNGKPFNCALPADATVSCSTGCLPGFSGSPSATCNSQGSWFTSGSCTSTPPPPDGESAGGITKDLFTKVFLGDTDKCGPDCPGYSSNPNTQAVVNKHWGFFKSAAAAMQFSFQNLDEASIFFGTSRHEYGGNLEFMAEFCGRKAAVCDGGYGNFFGRGPLQLTWENNYRAMGPKLVPAVDLVGNPAVVADNTQDIGWKTALRFWADSDFLCGGKWAELASLPTCPEAARVGNLATVTKRINPLECNGGPYASFQPGRIAQVQQLRSVWGMPSLSQTTC